MNPVGLRKRISDGPPREERDYAAEVEKDLDRAAMRHAVSELDAAVATALPMDRLDRIVAARDALRSRL